MVCFHVATIHLSFIRVLHFLPCLVGSLGLCRCNASSCFKQLNFEEYSVKLFYSVKKVLETYPVLDLIWFFDTFLVYFKPHSKGAKIDVCVNENYDTLFTGKSDDISSMVGFACSRDGPSRCIPATQVAVWR